ncbi:hypothetical protein HYY70_03055 [Candidatus Woesearchaeota archaeon]|nr:hypothetical protein [Candidatus Woesearchaeota archaeon]
MDVHEFWLKAGREGYGWNPKKTLPIYRVALGELIDATKRSMFLPPPNSHDPDFWNKSGSIGFMDLTVKTREVPKEGAQPIPNPDQNPYWEHEIPMARFRRKTDFNRRKNRHRACV